jgi:CRISPR-associated endonuclease/helicase Cas3
VDIAPYIRDPGSPQVQVFWREFDGRPGSLPPPHRPELCPISMGQLAAYRRKTVKKSKRPVWFWDPLDERWRPRREKDPVSPGSTLLLRAQSGGYNPDLGFVPEHSGQVTPLPPPEEGRSGDGYDGDLESTVGEFVTLSEHTRSVVAHVDGLLDALHPRSRADDSCELALRSAAEWHDVGKVHPAFQTALLDAATGRLSSEHGFRPDGGPWAKSAGRGRLHYRIEHEDEVELRPHFRHELASALAWLAHGDPGEHRDLVAYLVAAHHGRVRMGLRALPTEPVPDDDRLFARGVWEGDQLPAVHLNGISVPETTLQLDVMRLGLGVNGPSWTERARGLLSTHGPFRLAWLESLLRIADWRASAAEEAS